MSAPHWALRKPLRRNARPGTASFRPQKRTRHNVNSYHTYVATDSDGNSVLNALPWYLTRKLLSKFPVFAATSVTFPSGRTNATVESCSASLDATRTDPSGTNFEKCASA